MFLTVSLQLSSFIWRLSYFVFAGDKNIEIEKNENVTRNVANTLNQPTRIIFY